MNASTSADTKTPDYVATLGQMLAGVVPADVHTPSLAQRLRPWQSALRQFHRQGYSWDQLAEQLSKPQIGIAINGRGLRRILCKSHKRRTPAPVKA